MKYVHYESLQYLLVPCRDRLTPLSEIRVGPPARRNCQRYTEIRLLCKTCLPGINWGLQIMGIGLLCSTWTRTEIPWHTTIPSKHKEGGEGGRGRVGGGEEGGGVNATSTCFFLSKNNFVRTSEYCHFSPTVTVSVIIFLLAIRHLKLMLCYT